MKFDHDNATSFLCYKSNIYQFLHQYDKILTACNIQGERACEFSFDSAQNQYFVVLMQ